MNTFILNNIEERPHREIYDLDDKLKGFAIFDYDLIEPMEYFTLER